MKKIILFLLFLWPLYGQVESQDLGNGFIVLDPIDQVLWVVYQVSFIEGASYQIIGDSLTTMLDKHYAYDVKNEQTLITTVSREGARNGWFYAKVDTLKSIENIDMKIMFNTYLKFIGVRDE